MTAVTWVGECASAVNMSSNTLQTISKEVRIAQKSINKWPNHYNAMKQRTISENRMKTAIQTLCCLILCWAACLCTGARNAERKCLWTNLMHFWTARTTNLSSNCRLRNVLFTLGVWLVFLSIHSSSNSFFIRLLLLHDTMWITSLSTIELFTLEAVCSSVASQKMCRKSYEFITSHSSSHEMRMRTTNGEPSEAGRKEMPKTLTLTRETSKVNKRTNNSAENI